MNETNHNCRQFIDTNDFQSAHSQSIYSSDNHGRIEDEARLE